MIQYQSTPDYYRDYIAHYGVKGMKWHKKTKRLSNNMKELRKRNYNARKMADDILDGRRKYTPNEADKYTSVSYGSRNVHAKSTGYTWFGGARKDKSRKGQVQASSRYRKIGEPFNTATPTYHTSKKAVDSELAKRKKRRWKK